MPYVAARPMTLVGKHYQAGDVVPAHEIPERKLQGLLNLRKLLTIPDKPTSTTPRPAAFTGNGKGR